MEVSLGPGHIVLDGNLLSKAFTNSYVIDTNLRPILHSFRDIAFDRS